MKALKCVLLLLLITFLFAGCVANQFASYHEVRFDKAACIKPHDGYRYMTCHPLKVRIDDYVVTIPAEFDTDLASIPRWLWSFLSPSYAGFVSPSILHDYLYNCPGFYTRKNVDSIFYYALVRNGVSYYTAFKMYVAVRVFGGKHYHGSTLCIYEHQKKEYIGYD